MNTSSHKFLFILFVVLFFNMTTAQAAPTTWKLFNHPNPDFSNPCETYTRLALDIQGSTGTAELTDHVAGSCKKRVPLNKRNFDLVLNRESCGSPTYRGTQGAAFIEVTSYHSYYCDEIVPALIVVTETLANGTSHTLFSIDPITDPED